MTMTPATAQGRIGAMMIRKENQGKLELLHLAATYIFGANYFSGTDGEQITLESVKDLIHELDALKRQLPFLMNIKAGSSSDMKASSIYEDVYDQLCEKTNPHVHPEPHGGASIGKHSLCHCIVDNYESLVDYWLATKDQTTFELGDTFVDGLHESENEKC